MITSIRVWLQEMYDAAHPKRCGCGGELRQGIGCLSYYLSDAHLDDSAHESFMRSGGLGFGTSTTPERAAMSAHLQDCGMHYNQAWDLIYPPGSCAYVLA